SVIGPVDSSRPHSAPSPSVRASFGPPATLSASIVRPRKARFMRILAKSDCDRQSPFSHKRRNPLKIKGLRVSLPGLEPETSGLKGPGPSPLGVPSVQTRPFQPVSSRENGDELGKGFGNPVPCAVL